MSVIIGLAGGVLWSCETWELPGKKTQRNCEKPTGSLNAQIQQKKVDFIIAGSTGTIDKITWDFGNGSTTVTTGLTTSYTYPTVGSFSVKATLSNTCGNETIVSRTVEIIEEVKPALSLQPATAGVTNATVNFVINHPGNPAAVQYGICFSTSNPTPEVGKDTVIQAANPTVGGPLIVQLVDLAANTKYYYRAYAKLPSGEIVYSGTTESFTTQVDTLIQDLIASLSFTDGSHLDASGNNNHVTLVGNPTFGPDRKGRENAAVQLDGLNDYFYIGENSTLRPTSLSISIWIKPITVDRGMQIYNKSRFSDGAFEMYSSLIRPNVGEPGVVINTDIKQNSNCQGGIGWQTFGFTSNIQLNTWHHVVMVYSGNTAQMYFDNIPLYTKENLPKSTIDECPGGELKFGAQSAQFPNYFSGSLDDIRIYRKALTADEVRALSNQ
ncbi:LamG-like jellyroll fold domain-containing protein [Larkinella insperata]